jgi:hypothetical protein
MKIRLALSLVALLVVITSAAQLFAAPIPANAAMCCGSLGDCPKGTQCCDPSLIGSDCDPEAPGWCLVLCKLMDPK